MAALAVAAFAASPVIELSTRAATVVLPPELASPANTSTNRGFAVRTAQAPEAAVVANSAGRAIRQLNGTLTDESGTLVPNEAVAGTGLGGAYDKDTVNFERDGLPFDIIDVTGNVLWSAVPETFPGIPGTGGHTLNFAAEAVAFIELPIGTHTFGVSVGTDRTDVNDDDSFQVFVGANPRDYLNLKVGEFERNAPPFTSDTHSESLFSVQATVAGLYPFRILHWQTGRGSNLQLYTVDTNTNIRILVNDSATAGSMTAYRDSSVPRANSPYIGQISPNPGSAGNNPAEPIEIVLIDGLTTVATNTIVLTLNGSTVTPQTLTRANGRTTIRYNPNASRPDANNAVTLAYQDSAGASLSASWQFSINVAGGSATIVTGQWDFEGGTLAATVGQPLEYFDGPAGLTATGTKFGTTESGDFAAIPNIEGQPAKVMFVPGNVVREIGYVMRHGIAPNGGGTRVNQYTLIMDIYVGTNGPGAASLLQTSSLSNTDDGDLFWQGNNFGQGAGGYNGTGQFTAGGWHRMVAAYDMAATPPVVTKYVDGIKQDDWTANQGLDNTRRAMADAAILFADGDQDERREMWVNSIQIRSGKMSDAEIVLLGGPSASGIPQVVPPANVAGQWDFERGDLAATIGKPLQYFDGPTGLTATGTQFGTTAEGAFAAIPNIAGQPAKVMYVPGDVVREIGYVMDHGIRPNGGGTRVNQYTLIMDIYLGTTGPGAASLLQTSSLNNTDDGDLFWQGNNFGQGAGGYNGRGTFTAGAWHRVIAAYDMAASPPVVAKFVDGIKQDDWTANQGLDNPRRALQPTAILFADGDQDERREAWVNSIQIRPGRITDAEAVLLGGPSADGIPVATRLSTVRGQWDFEFGDLGATVGRPLTYFDGPTGLTATGTIFGTTGQDPMADVALIGGQPAKVMYVPGDVVREIGYVMEHGIAPNGGGTRVNQYTLIMDVMIDTAGPGAASMLQTSSLNNTDDGDLFWQGNNFGQGAGGYNGTGAFTAGAWHRVAAAYNMAATPPVVTKFVDGQFQDDWTANQGLDNPRRALQPTAILFADGDQDERRAWWVNSIQIREGALSKEDLTALGGPSAAGIPVAISVIPRPTLTVIRNGGSITISWDPAFTGFTLESAASLPAAGWTAVGGVVNNSVTLSIGAGNQFYRLRQ